MAERRDGGFGFALSHRRTRRSTGRRELGILVRADDDVSTSDRRATSREIKISNSYIVYLAAARRPPTWSACRSAAAVQDAGREHGRARQLGSEGCIPPPTPLGQRAWALSPVDVSVPRGRVAVCVCELRCDPLCDAVSGAYVYLYAWARAAPPRRPARGYITVSRYAAPVRGDRGRNGQCRATTSKNACYLAQTLLDID